MKIIRYLIIRICIWLPCWISWFSYSAISWNQSTYNRLVKKLISRNFFWSIDRIKSKIRTGNYLVFLFFWNSFPYKKGKNIEVAIFYILCFNCFYVKIIKATMKLILKEKECNYCINYISKYQINPQLNQISYYLN